MITVMGASGNTGRTIVKLLLDAGEKVRALGRTWTRLAELERGGAEVLTGDAADVAFLAGAFRGADAIYVLLPTDRRAPDFREAQDQQGRAITRAIRYSGVEHVVALSSLGADVSEGTGLIEGLHAQEERLATLPNANVLFLRPASFFENFRDTAELIRRQGVAGDSVAPKLAIPMVAARDIAQVAASALKRRSWRGSGVQELLGPRDLSYDEATRILGRALGRPDLRYARFTDLEMADALVQAGYSATFARLYIEMTRAINDGTAKPLAGRTPHNTTPTRFEDFVRELALTPEVA